MIRSGHIKSGESARATVSLAKADVAPVEESESVIGAFISFSPMRRNPVEIRSEQGLIQERHRRRKKNLPRRRDVLRARTSMKHVSRHHPGSGLRHPGNLGGHRVFSLRPSGLMGPPSAAARCDFVVRPPKPDCRTCFEAHCAVRAGQRRACRGRREFELACSAACGSHRRLMLVSFLVNTFAWSPSGRHNWSGC